MKYLVIDHHALLKYFSRQAGWDVVANILNDAAEDRHKILVSVLDVGELLYQVKIHHANGDAKAVAAALRNLPLEFVDVTWDVAVSASDLGTSCGIASSSCIAAAVAKSRKARLVTSDTSLKSLESELKIFWV
jgi:predicted nucleic acid-binding protein